MKQKIRDGWEWWMRACKWPESSQRARQEAVPNSHALCSLGRLEGALEAHHVSHLGEHGAWRWLLSKVGEAQFELRPRFSLSRLASAASTLSSAHGACRGSSRSRAREGEAPHTVTPQKDREPTGQTEDQIQALKSAQNLFQLWDLRDRAPSPQNISVMIWCCSTCMEDNPKGWGGSCPVHQSVHVQ